ncbi:hypothetical protein DSECCO2_545450 [anaerobic digester metagenome]
MPPALLLQRIDDLPLVHHDQVTVPDQLEDDLVRTIAVRQVHGDDAVELPLGHGDDAGVVKHLAQVHGEAGRGVGGLRPVGHQVQPTAVLEHQLLLAFPLHVDAQEHVPAVPMEYLVQEAADQRLHLRRDGRHVEGRHLLLHRHH